ncbi:MAG: alanine--tRNA ligase [Candidatus Baldrarchaeia archaeon]
MIAKSRLKELLTEEKYRVNLFRELGFVRKQCVKCGGFFWTLDPERTTCGDPVCENGYKFIGEQKGNWDYHETIERWCNFFERHGHARIKEYPVVARWRDDITFTIASIADFQPWVVSGIVDPPANPLVVPQPCLRFGGKGFNDVDNVGRTGRHFSLFVMGGQHAFNSDKWKGYWINRCIELNFKFLTEDLKIPPEEITYREDVWIGGGNFGPCLEAFAKGLEIVNNVFMQYEVLPDGSYQEMKIRVIDVGWGIERICWFSQGTPTAYEATFGPVLDWLKSQVGLKADEKLLREYVIYMGMLDVSEMRNIDVIRQKISKQIGVSYVELKRELEPLEALYAIADHTRALIFAIADGALPSNVGGGYNLRTILRRALSLNDLYNFEIDFLELFYRHIEYLKKTYERVLEAEGIIDDIFKVERERYYETLKRGESYVKRLLLKKRKLDKDALMELYESKGIQPETVQEIGKKLGIQIDVPSDFYVTIGEKRERKEKPLKQGEEKIKQYIESLPPTKELYYEDPYKVSFRAKVLKILQNKYVVLDRTCFYPTGGGQLYDTGEINGYKVVNVQKVNHVILHEIERKAALKEGQDVEGRVNLERRLALMRHHTATHIINEAARRVLGKHVWQAGAEKRPERARLDITHYKLPSKDEVRKIELLANKIVMENRPVRIFWMPRNEAEQRYGFKIYQGGVVPGRDIRIIEIKGWDVEACGGLHCENTGEVGPIKIIRVERIQDGVVRVEFCAGIAAIHQIQQQEELLERTADVFRVPLTQVPKTAERFFKEWKELNKEIEKLRNRLSAMIAEKIIKEAESVKGYKIIVERLNLSEKELVSIIERILEQETKAIVVLGGGTNRAIVVGGAKDLFKTELLNIVKDSCRVLGGSAGGKGNIVIGGGPKIQNLDDVLRRIFFLINEKVRSSTFT